MGRSRRPRAPGEDAKVSLLLPAKVDQRILEAQRRKGFASSSELMRWVIDEGTKQIVEGGKDAPRFDYVPPPPGDADVVCVRLPEPHRRLLEKIGRLRGLSPEAVSAILLQKYLLPELTSAEAEIRSVEAGLRGEAEEDASR